MDSLQIIGLIIAAGGAIVTVIWRISKKFHCVEEVKNDVAELKEELRQSAAELKAELKTEIANSVHIHEKLSDKIDEILKLLLDKNK